MTTALFGIPVAVIVIRQIAAEYSDRSVLVASIHDALASAERLALTKNRITRGDLGRFTGALADFVTVAGRIQEADRSKPMPRELAKAIREATENVRSSVPERETYDELLAEFKVHAFRVQAVRDRRFDSGLEWAADIPDLYVPSSYPAGDWAMNLLAQTRRTVPATEDPGVTYLEGPVAKAQRYGDLGVEELERLATFLTDIEKARDALSQHIHRY